LLSPVHEKVVVKVARQRNTAKDGLIRESQSERMMLSSQDRLNGLSDAVWRRK
jgi:co-chaperonin GroES (HSP10)